MPVRFVVGMAEEAEERVMVGQMIERLQLQFGQRDMVRIEIDRDDALGSRREIIEDVASARRDGDQPVMRLEFQRVEVDRRIFPDLVVHEALEHEREQALQRAALGGRGPLMRGALQENISHSSYRIRRGLLAGPFSRQRGSQASGISTVSLGSTAKLQAIPPLCAALPDLPY